MPKKNNINTFNDGLSMDVAADFAKSSTITDADNAVIIPKGGETFELQNMKGNQLAAFLPEGHFPKAINVFNGIAYIVSNKYDSDGEFEYTEIGTYPSPEWSALFPDKIALHTYTQGAIDDLSTTIYTAEGDGAAASSEGLSSVYSFSMPSFPGNIHYMYSDTHDRYVNMFDIAARNWYFFGKMPNDTKVTSIKMRLCILDKSGIDITSTYHNNLTIDIIRVDDKDPYGNYDINVGANSYASEEWAAIITTHRLHSDGEMYLPGKPNWSNGGDLAAFLSERRYEQNSNTEPFCSLFDIPGLWEAPFFSSDCNSCNLKKGANEHVFLIKTDNSIKQDISFVLTYELTSHSEHGSTYIIKSPSLNTRTGKYTYVSQYFDGVSSFQSDMQSWITTMNNNATTVQKQKSSIIFARHELNISDIEDDANCSFYGSLLDKKHYIAFRPLATSDKTFSAGSNFTVNYDGVLIKDTGRVFYWEAQKYLANAASVFGTYDPSVDCVFDKVTTCKVNNRTDSSPFFDASGDFDFRRSTVNRFGENTFMKLYDTSATEGDMVVFKVEPSDFDSAFVVSYYNQPYNSGNSAGVTPEDRFAQRDIGYLFNMYYNQFPGVNTPSSGLLNLKWLYRSMFTVNGGDYLGLGKNPFTGGLAVLALLSYNDIIAPSVNGGGALSGDINETNGQSFFQEDYLPNAYPIVADGNDYISYIEAIDSATYNPDTTAGQSAIVTYSCKNEGVKVNISFDLDNECCEGVKKNMLLHVRFNHTFAGNVKILFSSIYSYTGSIYEIFNKENKEVVLLFAGIPGDEGLDVTVTMDTDVTTFKKIFSSMSIVSSYYYCLEEKYSHLKNKYCPIFNFNTDTDVSDIYLLDSQNSNFAFRSNIFLKDDTDTDYELELQPNYDATINMIINDKNSKVKLINSRFAYDPSNNRCFIPQQYGFNDDNVYSNKAIHGTELIRRTNSVMSVYFNNIIEGGELQGGSYVYYFKYIDSDGNTTDVVNHSLPISVYNINTNDNDLSVGEKAEENTNAAVKLVLSNFDRLYKHIEVSFVYNAGEFTNAKKYYKIRKVYNIPLADELIIIHTGMESLLNIDAKDISKEYNHHEAVGSISQGKSRLVLSNEKLSDVTIFADIKKLALEMKIKEDVSVENADGFFKDSHNVTHKTGYWRGETYQIGIALKLIRGGVSPVFNPRGIDNYNGLAGYTHTTSINEFVGSYAENPYGIYRTSLNTDIYKVTERNGLLPSTATFGNVNLVIEGLKEFLDSPMVKSIAKGYIIYRKDRVKDAVLEGFVTPVFAVPFGNGYVPDIVANAENHINATASDDHEYINVDEATFEAQEVIRKNESTGVDGLAEVKHHIAPFGIVQKYVGDDNIDGYPDGSPTDKHALKISNILIKQDPAVHDKFGFISADMIADAEMFAGNFQGKGKYYSVSSDGVKFYNSNNNGTANGMAVDSYVIDSSNVGIMTSYLDDDLKFGTIRVSNETESVYIPEKMDTSTYGGFATKLDHTNMNFNTVSYIGVTEADSGGIGSASLPIIPKIVSNNYNNENPYGFLSRVYLKDNGALSMEDWKVLYGSKYQEDGYFPITVAHDINTPLEDIYGNSSNENLTVYGGDCFINKSFIRVLTKNGLDENFDGTSNIWDYTGSVDTNDFASDDFNKEDPASNSWFTDNEFMALKRARLIPKGMWVEVVHESNYNLALRTTEDKGPQEKVKYGKDRTFLPSVKKLSSYITVESNSSQLDSKGYNKGYSTYDGAVYNYALNDVEKLLRTFYARVEASDIAVKGALVNGYREMFGINYKDYDTQYGYISKVITFFDKTFVVFERGVAILPLSEKTQVTSADSGVYIDNLHVLGATLTILSGDNGSIHPDSVLSTKTGGYFYDHNANAIFNFSHGTAVKDISAYTIETFLVGVRKKLEGFRDGNTNKYISYNVKANYDILTGDITFTFVIYEGKKDNLPGVCDLNIYDNIDPNEGNVIYDDICNNKYKYLDDDCVGGVSGVNTGFDSGAAITLCKDIPSSESPFKILYSSSIYYNERIQKWVSPITFNPNFIFALNDKTFSMNIMKKQNRIYEHRSDNVNYSFFYEEQHNFSFEFVVNHNQNVQKVLENLMIVSNERVPITVSYDTTEKRSLIDNIDASGVRTRNAYDLNLVQDVKTRRFEVKIIGMSVGNDWGLFLNTNDSYVNNTNIGEAFTINGTNYNITGIASVLTDEGIMMPQLEIKYLDGTAWLDIESVSGTTLYEQVFGHTLKITPVNIINSDSDYIEDHMWVQVQLKQTSEGWREVRGRDIKVKINYDGIDKTFIHSVVSSIEESVN